MTRANRDFLGEGPVWDSDAQELLWVDIPVGAVHRLSPELGIRPRIRTDRPVSAAVPCQSGGRLLAIGRELRLRAPEGTERVLAEVDEGLPHNRLNDCRCDPQGRLWAGTMSTRKQEGKGALYRVTGDGEVTQEVEGTTISNGLAWSPSGDSMYFVDSTTRRIDVFDFDQGSGTVSSRRCFVNLERDVGLPDGLAADTDGGIWIAMYGGGAIRRYTQNGRLDEVIELPVSHPTCAAFGGPELDTLYITSAQYGLSRHERKRQPLAGALFSVRLEVRGVRAPAFAS